MAINYDERMTQIEDICEEQGIMPGEILAFAKYLESIMHYNKYIARMD